MFCVIFYIIPWILTTLLFTPFINSQGGQDYLEENLPGYDEEYYGYFLAFCSLTPLLNIAFAIILIFWYVLEIFSEIKNRIS